MSKKAASQPFLGPDELEEQNAGSAKRICGIKYDEMLWLVVFCVTGIGLGMSFEFMELHGGPADGKSFFLCLIGYWSQTVLGGGYALWQAGWSPAKACKGAWTKPVLVMLFISAGFDGLAQGLDYLGQTKGGYMLFTIFHASVTFWSCLLAKFVLKARINKFQWGGVLVIALGIFITSFPQPIEVPAAKCSGPGKCWGSDETKCEAMGEGKQCEYEPAGSFFWGLVFSVVGSACLAASYPFSELVFKRGEQEPAGPISEEMACCVGSAINSVIYTIYTVAYTVPRWDELVTKHANPGEMGTLTWAYATYGIMVALHSLSFWMSVNKLGTVPTAVAKGAQQAGVFVFSHLIFCTPHSDPIDRHECLDWNYGTKCNGPYSACGGSGLQDNEAACGAVPGCTYYAGTDWSHAQKSVALVMCLIGCAVYALNKNKKE
jgi:drug/metabolite transporter (DMT)-like permease